MRSFIQQLLNFATNPVLHIKAKFSVNKVEWKTEIGVYSLELSRTL